MMKRVGKGGKVSSLVGKGLLVIALLLSACVREQLVDASKEPLPKLARAKATCVIEPSKRMPEKTGFATPWLGITFRQGGKSVPMSASTKEGDPPLVALKAEAFQIRIPRNRPAKALQMNAWKTPENVIRVKAGSSLLAGQAKPGHRSVFGRGEGMATGPDGYPELFLSRNGHHYLVDERLPPLSDTDDGMIVNAVFDKDGGRRTYPITEQRDPLYLVFFLDADGDACIDPGEFESVRLEFR